MTIRFTDKNGRIIDIVAKRVDTEVQNAEEIVVELLHKLPSSELIRLPETHSDHA